MPGRFSPRRGSREADRQCADTGASGSPLALAPLVCRSHKTTRRLVAFLVLGVTCTVSGPELRESACAPPGTPVPPGTHKSALPTPVVPGPQPRSCQRSVFSTITGAPLRGRSDLAPGRHACGPLASAGCSCVWRGGARRCGGARKCGAWPAPGVLSGPAWVPSPVALGRAGFGLVLFGALGCVPAPSSLYVLLSHLAGGLEAPPGTWLYVLSRSRPGKPLWPATTRPPWDLSSASGHLATGCCGNGQRGAGWRGTWHSALLRLCAFRRTAGWRGTWRSALLLLSVFRHTSRFLFSPLRSLPLPRAYLSARSLLQAALIRAPRLGHPHYVVGWPPLFSCLWRLSFSTALPLIN